MKDIDNPSLVDVTISRGDLTFYARVPAEEAFGTATAFLEAARQLAFDYPDMVPHVEHVPGSYLPLDEDDIFEEGHRRPDGRREVGFHTHRSS